MVLRGRVSWSIGALLLLAACGGGQVRPARGVAYVSSDLDALRIRRVVLAPPSGPAADEDTRGAVQQAIAAVLSGRFGIEVLTAAEVGEDIGRDAELVTRGVVPSAALIELERRTRADAVLFVRVQAADPYPPQRLSMRADLIATRTGALLMRNTVSLDAADKTGRNQLRALAAERGLGAGRPLGAEVAFLSRQRFTELASAALLQPLVRGR